MQAPSETRKRESLTTKDKVEQETLKPGKVENLFRSQEAMMGFQLLGFLASEFQRV
jgi:hypothetical protein